MPNRLNSKISDAGPGGAGPDAGPDAGGGAIEQLVATHDAHLKRDPRLGRLNAPESVRNADARGAVQWLNRALRVERGLAVRGAAQYSFTRHVALLRALRAELAALGQPRGWRR